MEGTMELRHLRYFIAVAEAGSLTVAAEKKLHTAQPSLSRQIRDLEYEVGVQLMSRSVHGIELTAAGRAFLDHARLALTQAEAAAEAARRAAQPVKPTFAMGFLTGQEVGWLHRDEVIGRVGVHRLPGWPATEVVAQTSSNVGRAAGALDSGNERLVTVELYRQFSLGEASSFSLVDEKPCQCLMTRRNERPGCHTRAGEQSAADGMMSGSITGCMAAEIGWNR
jgi:Bacterial regulatory helix-turn-helix protein, lysR family